MAEISNINEYLTTGSVNDMTQLSSKELGKEDFLNLLVAELSNQNPLEPMDNKDMILQLSQFSALEGTQNLNENMDRYISTANLTTASSLIGKEVVYIDQETGVEMVGGVKKVNVLGDTVTLNVDGTDVKMYQLRTVYDPESQADSGTEQQ